MNTLKVIVLLIELSTVYSLRCYTCNSIVDPYCTTPFIPPDVGPERDKYLKDCDQLIKTIVEANNSLSAGVDRVPGLGWASICRKSVQTVDGEQRIHRSCGWYKAASEVPGCHKKAGSLGISKLECSCRAELCNGSDNLQINYLSTLISTVIMLIVSVINLM